MAAPTDLNAAKKNLGEALGDGMKLYLSILKSWFKQKISREDFDHEARKMLPPESVHLHNQFLLAILNKCQVLGSSLVQKKPSSHPLIPEKESPSHKPIKKKPLKRKAAHGRVSFQGHFVAANPLSQCPQIPPQIPEPEERGPSYASRDMIIPDIAMVHGRMIVSAWDFGLDDVQDDAVRLLMHAVEMQLKNILTVLAARRNGHKLREGHFRFGIGTQPIPFSIRNQALGNKYIEESEATTLSSKGLHMPSIKPSIETGQRDASIQLAAQPYPPTKEAITLFDLFDALQTHKSVLPAHAVYSVNLERIINRLWHPSNEELQQEGIHRQEVCIKRQLNAQQAVMRT